MKENFDHQINKTRRSTNEKTTHFLYLYKNFTFNYSLYDHQRIRSLSILLY
jgi:hypothetical protein